MMRQTLLLLGLFLGTSCAVNLPRLPSLSKQQCLLEVDSCETLNVTTCLGATLSYRTSSLILANDSRSEADVLQKLNLWSGLRNVPKCWEVIQPFLCGVYMPKCQKEGNTSYVVLPGQELCEQTRNPCKVVATHSAWPSFLQCHQPHFPPGCSETNPLTEVRFNTTSTCELPLVPTDNKKSWYEDVDGCGIQCDNPLFTKEEHDQVHVFIAVFGSLCMACTLFTVLSFMIDWKNANRYPALILFFINACFFIGSVGWMAQFIPGARRDIVCRSDNTMRRSEPQLGSGETASCTVVFILVYYFMMAGVTWFVILAYAWHLTFRALGYPRDAIEGKRGHFHLVAWSFPLVLTIVCLALTQIDGDSVSGICFVGYLNHTYRGFFVLLPIGLVMVIGFGFLISGLVTLIKMKIDTPGLISDKASAKIRETIIRLGVFASFALLFVIVTFVVHVYIFTNEPLWKKSFEDYIYCEANVTVSFTQPDRTKVCAMQSRPNLVAMEVHIFAYFGAGIVMSSWVWNKATLLTWKKFLKKKFFNEPEVKEAVKLRKHEVIAQAFSKRTEMNDGQISLSFYSVHDDPIGMRFDMNSLSSMEMSSAWAAAIPRLIQRRGGMAHPSTRRYSDSDVQSIQSTSFGPVSGVLIESHSPRRNSLQSHGSHSHSEQEESRKKKRKKRRHRRGTNRITPMSATTSFGPSCKGAGIGDTVSSILPSSQGTSLVSSAAEQPSKPQAADVVKVDVHQDDVSLLEEGEIPKVIDSDSIHSEDSNYTVMNEDELSPKDTKKQAAEQEGEEEEAEEEEEERVSADKDCHIPSENSAFKKYSTRANRKRKEMSQAAALQAHHHQMSSYSMVTALGYMPPGQLPPEYPEIPGMPGMPPMRNMPTMPDMTQVPNMPPMPMGPYTINNYPMTFLPQDFYMTPPGYVPQHYYSPAMPPPPYPPSYPMPSPNQPMQPPMYNPFENMMYPQQVQPVPYNRRKPPSQGYDNQAMEMTEIDCPSRSKKPRTGSELPTRSKRLQKMTEDDFPTRSRNFNPSSSEKELPSKSKHFVRTPDRGTPIRSRRFSSSSLHDDPVRLKPRALRRNFSSLDRAGSVSPHLPSISSTYHLDRVELEDDFSDESV